jgi:hypothetical protein
MISIEPRHGFPVTWRRSEGALVLFSIVVAVSHRMPILILASSDPSPGTAPDGLSPEAMLTGPKGTLPLRSGRCMAAELIARIRSSERFADPVLLGPRSWYAGKVDCEIVHVAGPLIDTLRQMMQVVQERIPDGQPFAVTPCDILPSADDWRQVMDNEYAPHSDAMFWWQLVQGERATMGAGAWKPAYRLPAGPSQPHLSLYPGHLVIARAGALRFPLMNRLLELAYWYRNRVLNKRYVGITCGALSTLMGQDLRNLARWQLPLLTVTVPFYGLRGFFRYRRGTATLRDVEHFLAIAFLHRRFHHAAGGRPVVIAISSLLSLAKDIDTQAELDEVESIGS